MTDRRKLDRDLDDLLRTQGARVDLVGAREIFRGILATPASDDESAWQQLIAPDADEHLMAALRELRQRIFESFNDDGLGRRTTDLARIQALRKELKSRDLDGFIVPKADAHQGEFVAPHAERLQWLTGFSGSAGAAVVMTGRKAAVFVDGRYTLQVKKQVDRKLFEAHHTADKTLIEWLSETLSAGMRLGFDPWLHTEAERKRLDAVCQRFGAYLTAQPDNAVDAVWLGQPPAPVSPILAHPKKFAGQESAKKRKKISDYLKTKGLDAVVLTAPDSIAWLLNIRGRDVPCTPVSLGFVVLHASGGVEFFTNPRKMSPGLEQHLGPEVVVLEQEALTDELTHLGGRGLKVGVDLSQAAAKIPMTLQSAGADVIDTPDVTALAKACKNATERDGMRRAHLRDGIALVTFLSWLEREAPKGKITEWDVGEKIDQLRTALDHHRGPSFPTIAGFSANGAIVHYRANKRGAAKLKKGSLLLVDSGGQYMDGTTDVTRTVAIGKPNAEMRDRFTRVLKGHIALARAVFPHGTSGAQLDALARKPLWDVGLDYDHGTGHGVGSYLNVHEGPQRISKHPSNVALQPGMVVSNEPGYYKPKGFGIRIENLVMVKPIKKPKTWEREMLGFETLTCAPFDLALIEPKLLDADEVTWVNDYHAWVYKSLSKDVDKQSADWLKKATRPLKK